METKKAPLKAAMLGFSGIIPFAATTAAFALGKGEPRAAALEGFLVYGAVILSFLGGIRWGAASSTSQEPGKGLIFSVLPSLWAALVLWWFPNDAAVWGLMMGFIVMGLADRLRPGLNVPAWMAPLRTRLTLAVVSCHLIVIGTG